MPWSINKGWSLEDGEGSFAQGEKPGALKNCNIEPPWSVTCHMSDFPTNPPTLTWAPDLVPRLPDIPGRHPVDSSVT